MAVGWFVADLGEHSREVLTLLGIDPADQDRLVADGTVGSTVGAGDHRR